MSNFDEYFTNDDKPFAENFNDALLLSNVFDFAVNIEMPTMFSKGNFLENYSPRKCGVAIVTLLENNGLAISNDEIYGLGKLLFKIYPNFNSFGNLRSISWTADGDITCDIENVNGGTLIGNVGNGEILNNANLKTLQEYVIHMNFNDATLTGLTVTFENKDSSNRYGANVKVASVDGLDEQLNQMNTAIITNSELIDGKVDKVPGKELSSNDFTNFYRGKIDGLQPVATIGTYASLRDKPNIPTKTSELTNDGADSTNVFVANNDSRLTNARTPTSHTHGNISNAGAIGSASGKLITTGTNGVLQAVDSITKSKISDFPTAMTPIPHTHTKAQITDFPTTMTPTSHSHGSLSNTGTLNSDISSVNKVAVTDSSNNLKTISKVPFANLNITKANITGLGIPSTNTTYSNATTSANGLMSSTDKAKLDGITAGATKVTVDSSLSSTSTNPVQNKIINSALSGKANSSHTHDDRYFTETEIINKLKWNEVSLANDRIKLYYNDYYCSLEINGAFTPTVKDSWTALTGSVIDSAYCPKVDVGSYSVGDVFIRLKVTSSGAIMYNSPQTFTSASTFKGIINWSRHS